MPRPWLFQGRELRSLELHASERSDQQLHVQHAEPADADGVGEVGHNAGELHVHLAPAGNRTVAADLGGRTATYGYDNDYRLTSEAIAGDPGGINGTVGYTLYDLANNRKTMTST